MSEGSPAREILPSERMVRRARALKIKRIGEVITILSGLAVALSSFLLMRNGTFFNPQPGSALTAVNTVSCFVFLAGAVTTVVGFFLGRNSEK